MQEYDIERIARVDTVVVVSTGYRCGRQTLVTHLLKQWRCSEATVLHIERNCDKVQRSVCIDDDRVVCSGVRSCLPPTKTIVVVHNIGLLAALWLTCANIQRSVLFVAAGLAFYPTFAFDFFPRHLQRQFFDGARWLHPTTDHRRRLPYRFYVFDLVVGRPSRWLFSVPPDTVGQTVCYRCQCPTVRSLNTVFCALYPVFGRNAYVYFWIWEYCVDASHANSRHRPHDRRCAALAIPYLQRLIDLLHCDNGVNLSSA